MMIGLLLHSMRPAAFSLPYSSAYFCFPGTPVPGFSAFIWKAGKCCARTVAFSSLPGGKLQTKRKDTKEKTSVSFGAEGETRTLAPVARPTPLAGAPLQPLEYFSRFCYKSYNVLNTNIRIPKKYLFVNIIYQLICNIFLQPVRKGLFLHCQ